MSELIPAIIEPWYRNNQINLKLLNWIEDEHLALRRDEESRSIGEQFIHLNKARLLWLLAMRHPLSRKLPNPAPSNANQKIKIVKALDQTALALGTYCKSRLIEANGALPGYRKPVPTFLSYLIAHESHHRGQVSYILGLHKVEVPDEIRIGAWDWENDV